MRAEWTSVWRGSGGLCVTVGGIKERHVWCAGRLDLEKEEGMCVIAQQHKINVDCQTGKWMVTFQNLKIKISITKRVLNV